MKKRLFTTASILSALILGLSSCSNVELSNEKPTKTTTADSGKVAEADPSSSKTLDTARYDKLMKELANGDTSGRWPAKAPYPLPGAILPFHRIVAFYGNLYSKKMGILGEIPKDEMLKKLKSEGAKWQAADTSIPVKLALHYIAVTAQGAAGKDGKHRLRMPSSQVDTILNWAKEIDGLVFLDVQVGHSTVGAEVPLLEKYLTMPQVHLAIDPEFSMKGGEVPGSKIGTFNADDINTAVDFLANVVRKNHLAPKILIVHRFTQRMVTDYQRIKKVPEVQIVMDMDGWGDKTLKLSSYLAYIKREPVQFAGFKLFYHNDTKTGADQLYTPQELLQWIPKPIYIQYQ